MRAVTRVAVGLALVAVTLGVAPAAAAAAPVNPQQECWGGTLCLWDTADGQGTTYVTDPEVEDIDDFVPGGWNDRMKAFNNLTGIYYRWYEDIHAGGKCHNIGPTAKFFVLPSDEWNKMSSLYKGKCPP